MHLAPLFFLNKKYNMASAQKTCRSVSWTGAIPSIVSVTKKKEYSGRNDTGKNPSRLPDNISPQMQIKVERHKYYNISF